MCEGEDNIEHVTSYMTDQAENNEYTMQHTDETILIKVWIG